MADSTPKPRAITPKVALPRIPPGQQIRDGRKVAGSPAAAAAAASTGGNETQAQLQSQSQVKAKAAPQVKVEAEKEKEKEKEVANGVDNGSAPKNGVFKAAVAPEMGWSALVGLRVSITNKLSRVLNGEVYSCDKEVLVLETGAQDYHIIPLAKISKYALWRSEEKKGSEDAALKDKERDKARQAKLREERLAKPPGVSTMGHKLFLALDKTLPVRWHNKSIIVLDNVLIDPPYEVDDCKAPSKHVKQLERVKELVRLEREKMPKDSAVGRRGG